MNACSLQVSAKVRVAAPGRGETRRGNARDVTPEIRKKIDMPIIKN